MKASALLDPGGEQRVGLEAGADREPAAEVLPALVEADLEPGVGLGVLVEAGDLVALAAASLRATEEPTRPQPTIRMNMSPDTRARQRRRPVGRLGRRGEQHPAGRLLQHVLGRGADLGRLGGADPAEHRPAADLASAARRRSRSPRRRCAAPPRRSRRRPCGRGPASVLTSTSSYSSADLAGALEGAPRLRLALRRQLGVERHGQRHLDHVDQRRAAIPPPRRSLLLLGRRRAAPRWRRCRRRARCRRPARGCCGRRPRAPAWSAPAR